MSEGAQARIEQGRLLNAASAARPDSTDESGQPADPFRPPAYLRARHDSEHATLIGQNAAAELSEGDATGAIGRQRGALDLLLPLVRDGYNYLSGLASYEISAADRADAYTCYG